MCQDSLAASNSKEMDNFEETVYLIKNCFYMLFYGENPAVFIVLRTT